MRWALILAPLLFFVGCTDNAGDGAPASPTPTTPVEATSLASPKAIFAASAEQPGLEEELAAVVLDPENPAALRYSALRRLEELESVHVVLTASCILKESDAPTFLKENTVAVLWRAAQNGSEAARDLLEQVRPEHEALLALLDR
jgi:hypothetical protein